MNLPKAIEQVLADLIRSNAAVGPGVIFRPWQTLQADNNWDASVDRIFPLIDIRCSAPTTADNQVARSVECAVLMGTNADDDRDHAFISNMFEEVHQFLDQLFIQFRAGNFDADPLASFVEDTQALVGDASRFRFGGLTFGAGMEPYDDGGINMLGITLEVHYSRDDI